MGYTDVVGSRSERVSAEGIITGGRLLEGAHGYAGELNHSTHAGGDHCHLRILMDAMKDMRPLRHS